MSNAKSSSEERQRALARWEGEGGGLGRAAQAADSLDEAELRITLSYAREKFDRSRLSNLKVA